MPPHPNYEPGMGSLPIVSVYERPLRVAKAIDTVGDGITADVSLGIKSEVPWSTHVACSAPDIL